ncbi:MAG: hypothetical protein M5U27_04235 [Gaiella sp.]|nr:hypothetical protein [Gaiella sp.]
MVRMQIQFTEEQASELRRQAAARRVSIAAVVRDAVDRELDREGTRREAWERALSAIGKYRGDGANVSVEHDKYLDEAWGH